MRYAVSICLWPSSEAQGPADDACLFGKLVTTSTHCDTGAVRAIHLSLRNTVGHPDSESACTNARAVFSCCPQDAPRLPLSSPTCAFVATPPKAVLLAQGHGRVENPDNVRCERLPWIPPSWAPVT
jgi:hypothetical protein